MYTHTRITQTHTHVHTHTHTHTHTHINTHTPQMACICLACGTAEVEDNEHFFLRCPFYNDLRSSLFDSIQHMSHDQGFIGIVFVNFNDLSETQQLEIVLGKRIGNAAVERGIDTAVKIFLEAAWTRRSDIRERLNTILSRTDT